ncbi:MAG TPA: putative toxin-antitoxin system toxin component, PIN family [Thermodesulfobacteriota bacterium]|nr:putative toxin-antitoxin system toxin component, PIN family [Thermodesulfobacteriota bacterium]
MKVVIDTNIWISYLLGGLLKVLDERILAKEITVVVSEEMLKELSEVTSRPKFRNIFTHQRGKELFSLLDNYATIVFPKQKVNACRDKKDNFLLEAALEGKAQYLVTGDEDLLVLKTFHTTKILAPKKFEDILKSM